MQKELEPFIAELQRAKTLDDLKRNILAVRDRLGIEHLVYHSVNGAGEQFAVLTYPDSWVQRYLERDYLRVDPVVQGCFRRFHPVDWKQLDWTPRAAREFLGEAVDAGVGTQGLSVPIRGPHGQFAMFTLSDRCSDQSWHGFSQAYIGALILMAHFINQKSLEIQRGTDLDDLRSLSPREVDALTMLALGMNRSQAADTLDISEHTLRAYVESARAKLGAANTLQAVARAVAEGLVVL